LKNEFCEKFRKHGSENLNSEELNFIMNSPERPV